MVRVRAAPLFASPHVALRCAVSPRRPPALADAQATADDDDVAHPQLEAGTMMVVDGAYESRSGSYAFVMPTFCACGALSLELTTDGVNWMPINVTYTVHPPLKVRDLSPSFTSLMGGAKLSIRASGLFASTELSAVFVKGATRIEVPATYDLDSQLALCVAPAWPPALAVMAQHERLVATVAAGTVVIEEGKDAGPLVEVPSPTLGEEESDLIVELSLNGQQWSTDCKHLSVVLDPVLNFRLRALSEGGSPPTSPSISHFPNYSHRDRRPLLYSPSPPSLPYPHLQPHHTPHLIPRCRAHSIRTLVPSKVAQR